MRIAVGDIQINCEESGEGTPLVLTHGLGSSLAYWDAHVPELSKYHRVIRWDVRGFGDSDKPAGPYSPEMFAADLARLLDALGHQRAHVAGVSMGGVIAQRFALDYPQRVRSLVLVSTSSEVGPKSTAAWQRLADRVERNGFDADSLNARRAFAPWFAETYPDVVRAFGEPGKNEASAYAAAARAMSDYAWTAELKRIDVPVLVLQGLADQLTPPGGSVKLSRALPRARLLMLSDAGHNLPIENPRWFAQLILAFTAGVDLAAVAV